MSLVMCEHSTECRRHKDTICDHWFPHKWHDVTCIPDVCERYNMERVSCIPISKLDEILGIHNGKLSSMHWKPPDDVT